MSFIEIIGRVIIFLVFYYWWLLLWGKNK